MTVIATVSLREATFPLSITLVLNLLKYADLSKGDKTKSIYDSLTLEELKLGRHKYTNIQQIRQRENYIS